MTQDNPPEVSSRQRGPTTVGGTTPKAAAAGPTSLRILLIHDDPPAAAQLKAQLERLGHSVTGPVAGPAEALDLYLQQQPSAVLADVRSATTDGLDLVEKLLAIRKGPVVVVAPAADPGSAERAARAGVFGFVSEPVQPDVLAAQLLIAVQRFADQERLLRENEQLQQTLTDRKLIERAKGVYMKHLKLDEPEAHRRLQLESQKRRMSMAELAKKVIESEDLLGGGG